VLELAEGGELFDFACRTRAFTEPVARYFFKELMTGINHLHSNGVAHRDLKLENLMLDH
jgi:serine/threonine protein kinase